MSFEGKVTTINEASSGNFYFQLDSDPAVRIFLARENQDAIQVGQRIRVSVRPGRLPNWYFPTSAPKILEDAKLPTEEAPPQTEAGPEVLTKPEQALRDALSEKLKEIYVKMPSDLRLNYATRYEKGLNIDTVKALIYTQSTIQQPVAETKPGGTEKPVEKPTPPAEFKPASELVFNLDEEIMALETLLMKATQQELASKVNELHGSLGWRVRRCGLDIWKIGRILKKEREKLPHGTWIDYCKEHHPEISLPTIERYIRIAEAPNSSLMTILDKTPSQAYRMLRIIKPSAKREEPEISREPVTTREPVETLAEREVPSERPEEIVLAPGQLRGKSVSVSTDREVETELLPAVDQVECPYCHHRFNYDSETKEATSLLEESTVEEEKPI